MRIKGQTPTISKSLSWTPLLRYLEDATMGKTIYIKNIDTGLVLTIKDNNSKEGGEIVMDFYHGKDNQHWKLKDGMIYSKLNKDLVLDIDEKNQKIITWKAHGRSNQKWTHGPDMTITSDTGVVMDVFKNYKEAGTPLIPYQKSGASNQTFEYVEK